MENANPVLHSATIFTCVNIIGEWSININCNYKPVSYQIKEEQDRAFKNASDTDQRKDQLKKQERFNK